MVCLTIGHVSVTDGEMNTAHVRYIVLKSKVKLGRAKVKCTILCEEVSSNAMIARVYIHDNSEF
jgi:hypothetical protein